MVRSRSRRNETRGARVRRGQREHACSSARTRARRLCFTCAHAQPISCKRSRSHRSDHARESNDARQRLLERPTTRQTDYARRRLRKRPTTQETRRPERAGAPARPPLRVAGRPREHPAHLQANRGPVGRAAPTLAPPSPQTLERERTARPSRRRKSTPRASTSPHQAELTGHTT